ncbi:MAG: glycosyltransferase [Candidatus Marinimicrobia bacterium]|jgi:cellulose synthase/poly-beta-1,6-N-acetylglucosamine synthase-like glycosyltransferase|nr:glycosyltransferase [Candidatus Neomarinimicrobiota bacterium]MDP6592987.1 glycosyltransferase [Candidatus Neomarinimicrobiota bacterium]MDP6835927.1 glycosyltransferase [Candidatus Neomarinimicrobiota bacterium]MDP6967428.1 glycosyltransferase [Candidatus Neomarinimicrobiota bacterium]|tara:strand:- start:13832 stop:14989 length:1158 start_codon:yes stop_codon:yes gene_type:complete
MIAILSLLAFTYFLFLTWLRNGLKTVSNGNDRKDTDLPNLSIIVAARNEEQHIGQLLEHLQAQDYPNEKIEIVIVNDGSIDSTGEIIDQAVFTDSRIRQLFVDNTPETWSPKKWALARGIQESSGELLLFTDADCVMSPGWARSISSLFTNENLGMAAGPASLVSNEILWNRMLLMDSIGLDALAAGGLAQNLPLTLSGRNLAVRRSTYEHVGGYDEIESFFSGDDDLMMHKISSRGWHLAFATSKAAEVTSTPPPDWQSFIMQRLRFASKGASYFRLPFVNSNFKWALILIYLTNISVLASQILFLATWQSGWLLPWFIKMMGDGILISRYTALVERPFDAWFFFADELWHSLYVVILGTLGSFVPLSWKGRKQKSTVSHQINL